MLGEIAINRGEGERACAAEHRAHGKADRDSSRPHSVTTTRALASLAPTDAKIQPCNMVTHDASTAASASRPPVAM